MDASQVLVWGAVGKSSTSVATHSGRASVALGYAPPSSTPTMSRVGGVLGAAVTLAVNRELPKWKVPPARLRACVADTVADPTPTGVTVIGCAPAAPQALSTS